jgi:hypothetical protein
MLTLRIAKAARRSATLLFFTLAAGCAKDAEIDTQGEERIAKPNATAAARQPIETDARADWSQRIAQYPASDRAYLDSVNKRYFSALERAGPNGISGVPSDKEWLDASRLTDSELRQRSEAGRPVDRMLYADRALTHVQDELIMAALEGREINDSAVDHWKLVADTQSRMALRDSKTIFAVYLHGYADSVITKSANSAAAAMLVAGRLGDPGAKQLMADLERKHPEINIAVVQVLYEGMMRTIGRSGGVKP